MLEFDEIEKITHFFQSNKVRIVKLNHCLTVSAPTEFESFMQLSADGDYFQITNKIPKINGHLITADKSLIEIEKQKNKQERQNKLQKERFGHRDNIVQSDKSIQKQINN